MDIVVNSYGAKIRKENGAFVITTEDGSTRIPAYEVTSIHIGRGIGLTSDAVLLALEHGVCIYFTTKSGMPNGMIWQTNFGSVGTIRKGQLMFTLSSRAADWIREVLKKKITSQINLLNRLSKRYSSNAIFRYVNRMSGVCQQIDSLHSAFIADIAPRLRGIEGLASRLYFEALNLFLPPVLRFNERTQHPAKDSVNALLNYGYGILYGIVELELIKAGIDPFIGVLHRDNYNKPVLVYDVIELYRVWVDEVVIALVVEQNVDASLCSFEADGGCWLEEEGRQVIIRTLNEFLAEVVVCNGKSRSRRSHIALYCQHLAQQFKKEHDYV